MSKFIGVLAALALLVPAAASSHGSYVSATGWPCSSHGQSVPIDANTRYVCLYGQWYIVHASH